jgi:hypothetical protein
MRITSYEQVGTASAITDSVTGMPGVWAAATGLFFIWGTVVTILFATKEDVVVEDEGGADFTIARTAMLDDLGLAGDSLCWAFQDNLIGEGNPDDTGPWFQKKGQTYTSPTGGDVELVFDAFTDKTTFNSTGHGACEGYGEDFSLTVKINQVQQTADPQLVNGLFRVVCSSGEADCDVGLLPQSSNAESLVRGFVESAGATLDGGIGTASVVQNRKPACYRTKFVGKGKKQVREVTSDLCPGKIVANVEVGFPEDANGKVIYYSNTYGLSEMADAMLCSFDDETSSWSSEPCHDCASASDCRYEFTVSIGNPGCWQPPPPYEDELPYCWADFCGGREDVKYAATRISKRYSASDPTNYYPPVVPGSEGMDAPNDSGMSCYKNEAVVPHLTGGRLHHLIRAKSGSGKKGRKARAKAWGTGKGGIVDHCTGFANVMHGANNHFCGKATYNPGYSLHCQIKETFGSCGGPEGSPSVLTISAPTPPPTPAPTNSDEDIMLAAPTGYTVVPAGEKVYCANYYDNFIRDDWGTKYIDVNNVGGKGAWTSNPFTPDATQFFPSPLPQQSCSDLTKDLISAEYCATLCDSEPTCVAFNMNYQQCWGGGKIVSQDDPCHEDCGTAKVLLGITQPTTASCCGHSGILAELEEGSKGGFGCYLFKTGCSSTGPNDNEYIRGYIKN